MKTAQKERRPTIVEVAKLAGVSFKTVARVVNNETSVKPEKREAVLRAMKMLNYVPNISARQLASNKSFLIAMLFDAASDYVARAQSGAITRCREAGYHLIVEEVPAGYEIEVANRLQNLRVDGIILTPPLSRHAQLRAALAERDLRCVLLSPDEPDPPWPSVSLDDQAAAHEMTKLLIGLGHRRIGFISGGARPASRRRRAGYLAALDEAGLPHLPDQLEAEGDFSFRSGEVAADRLLRQSKPPTAIFAASDAMALGVMVVARSLEIRVPDQLSIAGFDDAGLATVVSPQLTTVRQPLRAMSAAAVGLLLDRQDADTPAALQFDFEIVKRGSTAPPA